MQLALKSVRSIIRHLDLSRPQSSSYSTRRKGRKARGGGAGDNDVFSLSIAPCAHFLGYPSLPPLYGENWERVSILTASLIKPRNNKLIE